MKGFLKNAGKGILVLAVAVGVSIGSMFAYERYIDDDISQEDAMKLHQQIDALNKEKETLKYTIREKEFAIKDLTKLLAQEASADGISVEQSKIYLQLLTLAEEISSTNQFDLEDRKKTNDTINNIMTRIEYLVSSALISNDDRDTITSYVEQLKIVFALKNMDCTMDNTFSAEALFVTIGNIKATPEKISITTGTEGYNDTNSFTTTGAGDRKVVENGNFYFLSKKGEYSEGTTEIAYKASARAAIVESIESFLATNGKFKVSYNAENDIFTFESRGNSIEIFEFNIDDEKIVNYKITDVREDASYTTTKTFEQITSDEFEQKYSTVRDEIEASNQLEAE